MQRRTTMVMPIAFLAAAVSPITRSAGAQKSPIGAGSWIISGAASVSSNHDETSDQTVTSIFASPSGLFFVRPRLAIGGSVSLGYLSTPLSNSTTFGIGPSVRYYFGDTTGKVFPFLSATVSPTWQSSDPKTPNTSDFKVRNLAIDGSLGITRLVATHVGITGEAFYTRLSGTTDIGNAHTDRDAYTFGLRFGITAFVF